MIPDVTMTIQPRDLFVPNAVYAGQPVVRSAVELGLRAAPYSRGATGDSWLADFLLTRPLPTTGPVRHRVGWSRVTSRHLPMLGNRTVKRLLPGTSCQR
jgi:hypothetical protein